MKTIIVEIEEVPEKKMYFREHLGDGKMGKIKFEADTLIPSRSLFVRVEDKEYLVHIQKVIEQVVKFHEEQKKLKK